MQSISMYESARLQVSTEKERSQAELIQLRQQRLCARQKVEHEMSLAALDRTDISCGSWAGRFAFDFSGSVQSGGTQMRWEGNVEGSLVGSGTYQANFSFGFSIASGGEVQLAEGVEAGSEGMRGPDFEFSRGGLLRLLMSLLDKLGGEQEEQELDLGGPLDQRALEMLQKLGLLDDEGKATPMLQFLSDYAGLNRFGAGQQVRDAPGGSYATHFSVRQAVSLGHGQRLAAGHALTGRQGPGERTGPNQSLSGTEAAQAGSVQAPTNVQVNDQDLLEVNIYYGGSARKE